MDKVIFSSARDDWETPPDFFAELDAEFHFTLDPCAQPATAKCAKYYTPEQDGLKQSWAGETVFCNPPYGRAVKQWVAKCAEESKHATVVMLIPARVDTNTFHDYIYHKAEVRFLRGRLHFLLDGKDQGRNPFPSMVVIFRRPEPRRCPCCGARIDGAWKE